MPWQEGFLIQVVKGQGGNGTELLAALETQKIAQVLFHLFGRHSNFFLLFGLVGRRNFGSLFLRARRTRQKGGNGKQGDGRVHLHGIFILSLKKRTPF